MAEQFYAVYCPDCNAKMTEVSVFEECVDEETGLIDVGEVWYRVCPICDYRIPVESDIPF